MTKDIKIFTGLIVFSFLVVIGTAFLKSDKGTKQEKVLSARIQNLEVNPTSYDIGNIKMKDGNVIKTFNVTNTSDYPVKLKRIATSCMCTKAKVKTGNNETKEFGMEGAGDKNPPVNLELQPGQTAIVTAIFDPAAHGPKGVGPFNRSVYLYFSDPVGMKELKFNGTVIN